ncbi:PhoH family protein [bacterium]|jgi:PhoH-like ATPase|nr:PhoH family protein [bacterium]MBT5015290.1 PhoH family protein [bacterium]
MEKKIKKKKKSNKVYVLDTNVLIHDPMALYSFADSAVALPIIALEELDRFKNETTDRGRNSRNVIRRMDDLRLNGSLREGVRLDNGGTFQVLFNPEGFSGDFPLSLDIADNEILLSALALKEQGKEVCFVSKDINARVKADILGIHAEDYLKGKVEQEEFYKGWLEVFVPAVQLKKEYPDALGVLLQEKKLFLNEFVLVTSQHNTHNYKLFRYLGQNKFKPVFAPKLSWPMQPRNAQQLMALDLLFDPTIQFVSLLGPAGTGKTFLAVLAGLYQVLKQDLYTKMLVSRPVIPLGPDIGYLPGDLQEKMHSWMQPIYDNVDLIMHNSKSKTPAKPKEDKDDRAKKGSKRGGKKQEYEAQLSGLDQIIKQGKVSLEAITYMRGRSIPFQYVLIDEVQNLSPHEVKTLISRIGQDSKIVLAGDPFQIDSPYLDFSSNGLVVGSNAFKNHAVFGTVFLENSERSELSRLAGELL